MPLLLCILRFGGAAMILISLVGIGLSLAYYRAELVRARHSGWRKREAFAEMSKSVLFLTGVICVAGVMIACGFNG